VEDTGGGWRIGGIVYLHNMGVAEAPRTLNLKTEKSEASLKQENRTRLQYAGGTELRCVVAGNTHNMLHSCSVRAMTVTLQLIALCCQLGWRHVDKCAMHGMRTGPVLSLAIQRASSTLNSVGHTHN